MNPYAAGARSFASSSAVVLCTTRGGKLHIIGIIPPGCPPTFAPLAVEDTIAAPGGGAPGGWCITIIPGGGYANCIDPMNTCSWCSSLCFSC